MGNDFSLTQDWAPAFTLAAFRILPRLSNDDVKFHSIRGSDDNATAEL